MVIFRIGLPLMLNDFHSWIEIGVLIKLIRFPALRGYICQRDLFRQKIPALRIEVLIIRAFRIHGQDVNAAISASGIEIVNDKTIDLNFGEMTQIPIIVIAIVSGEDQLGFWVKLTLRFKYAVFYDDFAVKSRTVIISQKDKIPKSLSAFGGLLTAVSIDGVAKMPLQASIFTLGKMILWHLNCTRIYIAFGNKYIARTKWVYRQNHWHLIYT